MADSTPKHAVNRAQPHPGSDPTPTAWIANDRRCEITTDIKTAEQWAESGIRVSPLFFSRDVPSIVRDALDNSNSLLTAMLVERQSDKDIESQIAENRQALIALGPDYDRDEQSDAPTPP